MTSWPAKENTEAKNESQRKSVMCKNTDYRKTKNEILKKMKNDGRLKMTEKINELITSELASANVKFPPFHSYHEAYSVLREEAEETCEAVKNFLDFFQRLWEQIKKDEVCKADIEVLKIAALEIIEESIQVAAMCEKFSDFMKTQPDNTSEDADE